MAVGASWLQPVSWSGLEKRSQALRGRNLARDIQASGAPMVHPTPGCNCRQGLLSLGPLDTGVDASENPLRNIQISHELRLRAPNHRAQRCDKNVTRSISEGLLHACRASMRRSLADASGYNCRPCRRIAHGDLDLSPVTWREIAHPLALHRRHSVRSHSCRQNETATGNAKRCDKSARFPTSGKHVHFRTFSSRSA